jgi:hypothetical protein
LIQIQLQQHDPRLVMEAGNPRGDPGFKPFGDDGLTFADIVDIVNPLQHIPIVGTFYRKLTGDTIDPAIRIAGGALFGGPLGALASTMAVAVNEARRVPVDDAVAIDGQLAERAPPPGNPLSDAHARTADAATRPQPAAPDSRSRTNDTIATRAPRRGGWMVAQAYGETLSRFAELAPGHARGSIDETV